MLYAVTSRVFEGKMEACRTYNQGVLCLIPGRAIHVSYPFAVCKLVLISTGVFFCIHAYRLSFTLQHISL